MHVAKLAFYSYPTMSWVEKELKINTVVTMLT